MADLHILAVHTYGSQRVKKPGTNQTVSAYKIGYSSAACETLLTLYGAKARDVSSPHASYRYLQIDGETTIRHGYLLLNVNADELARAEVVTRQHQRAAVYLWQDNRWLELPHGRNPLYAESASRSGPGFNPSGFRPFAPSTGEKEAAVVGIQAEKSQRDPDQKPWWWILGDTYPQRETLKRWGARFSSKRRAWYYIGWELPDGIRQLVTHITETTNTETEAPSAPVMSAELEAQILDALAEDDAAEARNEAVLDTVGVHQVELPTEAEKPPVRVIKPLSIPVDGTPLDEVQAAIVQAKTQPTLVLHAGAVSQKRTLTAVGQSYVGELTGSISGDVHCYGYAIHEGICIFVNMGGPRMAVEAVRAKLSKGDIVSCTPWDAPAVELTAGEGNSGMYHDYFANIPEAKFTSLILCHDLLVNPRVRCMGRLPVSCRTDRDARASDTLGGRD
jgi:hypothetical protein